MIVHQICTTRCVWVSGYHTLRFHEQHTDADTQTQVQNGHWSCCHSDLSDPLEGFRFPAEDRMRWSVRSAGSQYWDKQLICLWRDAWRVTLTHLSSQHDRSRCPCSSGAGEGRLRWASGLSEGTGLQCSTTQNGQVEPFHRTGGESESSAGLSGPELARVSDSLHGTGRNSACWRWTGEYVLILAAVPSVSSRSVFFTFCTLIGCLVYEISPHLFRGLSLLKAPHPSFPPIRAPRPGRPNFCLSWRRERGSSPKPPLGLSCGLERFLHYPWIILLSSSLR